MIKAINKAQNNMVFSSKSKKNQKADDETRILPNNMNTKIKQGFQKTSSAFLDYPAKGLTGDINSNFYEFLTMGIVPYLAGSGMFMIMFNCVNKYLLPADKKIASTIGKKFALGVVLYGVLKNLSKNLVTKPIKLATGIDTEMPYENIVYPLPKEAGENANIEIQHQQRKVYDSKEFFRKDLLDREYFDKVAKKLGLGENLNDSITEATPIIQNIVATSNTAKSLSSYSWAAVGVGLAMQDAWLDFFEAHANRKHFVPNKNTGFFSKLAGKTMVFVENTWNLTKEFSKSTVKACKQLWNGNSAHSGFKKHSGKALVGFAAILTTLLTANTIIKAKNMAKNNNLKTIDKNKESTVI